MGRKRSVQKIPNSAKIKCPHCLKNNQVKLDREGIFTIECRKCKQKIETPVMQCCLVCAYSGKKCYTQLLIEAHQKNLEIKF